MNFLVQTVLSPSYNVLAVSDVYAGMHELKRKDTISLIIIDADYQTNESLDFIHHVKTSSLYQETAVFVLASSQNWKDRLTDDHFIRVDECFYKPFSPQNLLQRINEVIYGTAENISSI